MVDFIPSPCLRIFVYNLAASLCLSLQDLMPSSLRTAQKELWRWLWLLSMWSPTNRTPDQLTLLQEPFANDELFSGGRASEMIVDWPYRFCHGLVVELGQQSVDETRYESIDLGFCYQKSLPMTYHDHGSHTALAGSVVFIPSHGCGLSGDSCRSIVVVDIIIYFFACTRVSSIRFQFDKHRNVASFCF